MNEFSFLINGQPMSKKRNWHIVAGRRGGRLRIALAPQYKAWEKNAVDQLWIQKTQYAGSMIGVCFPIIGHVEVEFLFFMRGHPKIDLSNLIQGPEDALVAVGILKDDSLIASYDGSRKYLGVDNPHVEITMREFKGTEG